MEDGELEMEEENANDDEGYGRGDEALKIDRETDDREVKNIVDPRLPRGGYRPRDVLFSLP